MGFNSVYRVLQELFPQVDSRMLRAVAIEHSKDADTAVEAVIVEVIPFLSKQSPKDSPSNKKTLPGPSEALDGDTTGQPAITIHTEPVDVIACLSKQSTESSSSDNNGTLPRPSEALDGDTTGQPAITIHSEPVDVIACLSKQSTEASSSDNNGTLPRPSEALDAGSCGQPDSTTIVEPVNLGFLNRPFHDANGETDDFGDDIDGEPLSLKGSGEKSKTNSNGASSAMVSENGSCDIHDQECGKIGGEDVTSLDKSEVSSAGVSASVQDVAALEVDVTTMAAKSDFTHLHLDFEPSNQSLMPIVPASSQLEVMPETQLAVTDELDPSSSSKAMSEIEMVNPESTMNSVITRSDQICSTELLEDIIEDARDNKKTLVSTMDSVISLMREVECKEKAAEQAKEEAARGCLDILAKVDELKQALRRAKEANDMHAGEVYAEKAILATELKELQLRLLGLSDERDRSLGILDEMRRALEMRLAASLQEIEAAEKEKLEKEQYAREALAYQESQMEKVFEESTRLKLEAEENSELQEFLMDRGRAIDVLQGEIFVKCQDVKLLKEKFDKRIPLGRSLSSSQASSILASSSSSVRSFTTPDSDPDTYKTPKNTDLDDSYGFLEKSSRSRLPHSPKALTFDGVSFIDDRFPFPSGAEQHGDEGKVLVDDGWELFDKVDLRLGA